MTHLAQAWGPSTTNVKQRRVVLLDVWCLSKKDNENLNSWICFFFWEVFFRVSLPMVGRLSYNHPFQGMLFGLFKHQAIKSKVLGLGAPPFFETSESLGFLHTPIHFFYKMGGMDPFMKLLF